MTAPLETRVAGLFVFWPLLAQLGFDDLIKRAGYPGSEMVPATSALLSLLALKLIDKERQSHISDFNFDEALGLFAGLNILPKATFATGCDRRLMLNHIGCNPCITRPPGSPTGRSSPRTDPTAPSCSSSTAGSAPPPPPTPSTSSPNRRAVA
jgi:hypothetical protein